MCRRQSRCHLLLPAPTGAVSTAAAGWLVQNCLVPPGAGPGPCRMTDLPDKFAGLAPAAASSMQADIAASQQAAARARYWRWRRRRMVLLPFVLLAAAVADHLEELDTGAFLDLASANVSLIEFYAPWCEPCTELQPAFESVAKKLAEVDPPIRFGRIDAEKEKAVATRYNVTAYPDLRVFRGMTDYKVPSNVYGEELLLEHMQHQVGGSQPPVEVREPKQLEHLSRRTFAGGQPANSVVVLGLFPPSARSQTAGKGAGDNQDEQERAAQLAMGRGARWTADMELGQAELALFGDLAWELRGSQLGYTLAYSFTEEMQALYGGGVENNGTLVIFLAESLRLGTKEKPPPAEAASADPIVGQLPYHDRGHARLDLGALLLSHTSKVSTQSRDQRTRGDGSEMHETEIASRLAIYHAHVAKASRVAMREASKWVLSASRGRLPLIGELSEANTPFSAHPYFRLPICILFYAESKADTASAPPTGGPKSAALWRRQLREAAAASTVQGLTFVLASADVWSTSLQDLGLSPEDFTEAALVIVDEHMNKFFFLDTEEEFDATGLRGCVERWGKGKAKQYVRSQPPPSAKNLESPVKVVVGSTFASMVTDDNGGASPDVLIQIFAPHDQTCRTLAKYYQQLAQQTVAHPSNSRVRALRVAAIDISRNDIPAAYQPNGLPTLWLVRKGERSAPIRMELSGNANEIGAVMMTFLEKHLPDDGGTSSAGDDDTQTNQQKKDEL
eukprot:COSAG05_NODE_93_length_19581_cov_53.686685_12_plen_734_part_00